MAVEYEEREKSLSFIHRVILPIAAPLQETSGRIWRKFEEILQFKLLFSGGFTLQSATHHPIARCRRRDEHRKLARKRQQDLLVLRLRHLEQSQQCIKCKHFCLLPPPAIRWCMANLKLSHTMAYRIAEFRQFFAMRCALSIVCASVEGFWMLQPAPKRRGTPRKERKLYFAHWVHKLWTLWASALLCLRNIWRNAPSR